MSESNVSRRAFLQTSGLAGLGVLSAPVLGYAAKALPPKKEAAETVKPAFVPEGARKVSLHVNGAQYELALEPRVTLLDCLRESLQLTGTKKGCDHGQGGACTVLVDGKRINSCLTLAIMQEGKQITTIEGLAEGDAGRPHQNGTALASGGQLHPLQQAFIDHDAFQCGYCTPGQICSAAALVEEQKRGELSQVSFETGKTQRPQLTDEEIRERMSGNICRCGAYTNIADAVLEVLGTEKQA